MLRVLPAFVAFVVCAPLVAHGVPGTITRVPDGGLLVSPADVSAGDGDALFVADPGVDEDPHSSRILRIDPGQTTTLLSGELGEESPVHGLPAGASQGIRRASGVAALPNGDVAIVAAGNACVASIETGVVRLLAGWLDGPRCVAHARIVFDPDGTIAARAPFAEPAGIAPIGAHLYVADAGSNRIRRIDATAGGVATLAGSRGVGPASGVALSPRGLVAAGELLWIADVANGVVRVLDPSSGGQAPVAGSAVTWVDGRVEPGPGSEEGPALHVRIPRPVAVARDGAGNLYVADRGQRRVWRIDGATGIARPLLGGSGGAGQRPIPEALAMGPDGALYVAQSGDLGQGGVARIDVTVEPPVSSTVAGGGAADPGDGRPPANVRLRATAGLAFGPDGRLYLGETGRHCIRVIDFGANTIDTIAGTGQAGHADAPIGTDAALAQPTALAIDVDGSLLVADTANAVIRRVATTSPHAVTTVAGGGSGEPVDGVAPLETGFLRPSGLAVDATGALFIADEGNNLVRRIAGGVVTTVAGNGTASWSGDGGQAASAQLSRPRDVARDAAGNVYVADQGNQVVRRVDAVTGVITTYAGRPGPRVLAGSDGDGGPALDAVFVEPTAVAFDHAGNLYVSDTGHHRIRRVAAAPPHVVTTVVGTGEFGVAGDGGPATEAALASPLGIDVGPDGALYVVDGSGVRMVEDIAAAPGVVLGGTTTTTTRPRPTTTVTLLPVTTTTQPPFSPRPPQEICGDCVDNDGDGRVDFEDDECCRANPVFALAVERASHARRRGGTSLQLTADLVGAVAAGVDASARNVVVQLRRPGGEALLCAYVPSTVFLGRRRRALVTYTDKRGTIGGIRALALRRRGDDLRMRLRARRMPFTLPAGEPMRITIGFRDVLNAHRCATVETPLR